jgi:hypothetical protein
MKKILLITAGLAAIGIIAGVLLFNKPHKNIRNTPPDYSLTSQQLFTAFASDEAAANKKYLDKIIQLKGKVTASSIDEEGLSSITLEGGDMMFGVICKLDALAEHKRKDFAKGEEISVKGICSGMLMDVVLVRCVEI